MLCSTIDENVMNVPRRLVGWWLDTGWGLPLGEVGEDGTVCVCGCVCDRGRESVSISLGRDLSTAGFGVVGVTGLERDLVYREREREIQHHTHQT